MTWRGIFAGALGLIALEAVLQAPGRVGSMLTGVAGLVERVLDPSVPAVPDLAGKSSTSDTGPKVQGIDPGTGSAPKYGPSGPNDPPGGFVPMTYSTPVDPQSVYT